MKPWEHDRRACRQEQGTGKPAAKKRHPPKKKPAGQRRATAKKKPRPKKKAAAKKPRRTRRLRDCVPLPPKSAELGTYLGQGAKSDGWPRRFAHNEQFWDL